MYELSYVMSVAFIIVLLNTLSKFISDVRFSLNIVVDNSVC